LNVKKVILFGSYARGNYTNNSDIDVCIIAENISNNYLAMLQIAPKVIDIDVRMEPVVFSNEEFSESNLYGLLKEVKNYGIEV
ncbi:MAG: nucleotidyltransferase domain-containing protein, partial [Candidatus Desantisbacteria bacterium]